MFDDVQFTTRPIIWEPPPTHYETEVLLSAIDDLLRIQCWDGHWNANPYMHGLANGMHLVRSIISGEDPAFLDAPDRWLDDEYNKPGGDRFANTQSLLRWAEEARKQLTLKLKEDHPHEDYYLISEDIPLDELIPTVRVRYGPRGNKKAYRDIILYHAGPKELSSVSAGSFWAADDPEDAILFGLDKNPVGTWLHLISIPYSSLDDYFLYAGIIDSDLGGNTRMYKNKIHITPDYAEWVTHEDLFGEKPYWMRNKMARQRRDSRCAAKKTETVVGSRRQATEVDWPELQAFDPGSEEFWGDSELERVLEHAAYDVLTSIGVPVDEVFIDLDEYNYESEFAPEIELWFGEGRVTAIDQGGELFGNGTFSVMTTVEEGSRGFEGTIRDFKVLTWEPTTRNGSTMNYRRSFRRRKNANFDTSQIEVTEDEYGTLYILPGISFTGNIEEDISRMVQDPELDSWLYGELGSDESITDERGEVIYAGADVQDLLRILSPVPERPSIAGLQKPAKYRRRTAALKRVDRLVIESFLDGRPDDTGRLLWTDGEVLELLGLGGGIVAILEGDYVHAIEEYSSSTEQSIVRYLKKKTPSRWWRQDLPYGYSAGKPTGYRF